ncbi:MAG: hypothetical protein ACYDA6_04205 [Solirubrobacteraceae bacterium]
MSGTDAHYAGSWRGSGFRASLRRHAKARFASDTHRAMVSALGLMWLLDGALGFQSFMYSNGFVELLRQGATGQPLWLESSITWSAHIVQHNLTAWNTLFALIQVLIGLGLLYRPTVKPALALSFAWALLVWWFAESFGMLFMMMATPLAGAPGAVLLYAIVGLIVWPTERPGGLLGVRGARTAWTVLWLGMAWLWLEGQSSSPGAITHAIKAAPSGMGWLTSVQHWAAAAAEGNGLAIALLLALLSAAIGIAVAANWHPKPFLLAAVVLNLVYWVIGQGFGGIFTGAGTDPNAGPLFVLLACVLYMLIPYPDRPVHDRPALPAADRHLVGAR